MIFFLLSLFSITESLVCNAQWQCSSVATDYNYVNCVLGQCQCSTLGFVGNASLSNKCRCILPNKVYWENGLVYCINYNDAVKYNKESTQEDNQLSKINLVYNSLIWPAPAGIIYSLITGTPNPIFDLFETGSGVKGRVDPVGTFSGNDGVVEYFYGAVWTGSPRISKVTFKKFISQNNIVHVNVVLLFDVYDQTQQNKLYSYNLTQSGSFTFDNQGKISSTDLIIHNLGAATTASNPISDPKSPAFIQQVCGIILLVANCTSDKDPSGYYTDFADCMNSFTNVYEGGTFDNIYFNGNTSVCRFYHSLLAIARPDHHCSHAGKSGGGKCINHPYESYYNQNY